MKYLLTLGILLVIPSMAQAQNSTVVSGDLTGDGRVAVNDAVLALRIAVGTLTPSAHHSLTGDINGDGKVNIQDVTAILRAAAGIQTLPPPKQPPQEEPPVVVQFDRQFAAGTRVSIPWTGASFVIPQGWTGVITAREQVFYMTSPDHSNTVAIAQTVATAPEKYTSTNLAAILNQPSDLGGGVVFTPSSAPTVTDSEVSVTYSGTVQGAPQPLVGYSRGTVSPEGNALAFFIGGPQDKDAALKGVIGDLHASVRLVSPDPPLMQLYEALSGYQYPVGSDSDFEGGSGGHSFVGRRTVDLCGSGEFLYYSKGSFSTDAGTINTEEQKVGRWQVVVDMIGSSILLTPNDGSGDMEYRFQTDGQQFAINGKLVSRTPSEVCP